MSVSDRPTSHSSTCIRRGNTDQKQLTLLDKEMESPQSPYNPRFTPPPSQDASGLEMGMDDHRLSMAKEDFAILTTTMDGIINCMNVMSDQFNNHTSLIMNEMKNQTNKILEEMKVMKEVNHILETTNKPSQNKGACYICKDPGHYAPNCPNRQSTNQCFNCKQEGHWAKDCPQQGTIKNEDPCFRCGELGHWIKHCQADLSNAFDPSTKPEEPKKKKTQKRKTDNEEKESTKKPKSDVE